MCAGNKKLLFIISSYTTHSEACIYENKGAKSQMSLQQAGRHSQVHCLHQNHKEMVAVYQEAWEESGNKSTKAMATVL